MIGRERIEREGQIKRVRVLENNFLVLDLGQLGCVVMENQHRTDCKCCGQMWIVGKGVA